MAAALFGWGAWQRRWIADDGLIVLRTVRNLLAGNGPVFNEGERVESNTSTLWTYLNYLGGVIGGPVRLEYVALVLALVLSVAGVVFLMLGAGRLYAPSLQGRRALLLPAGVLVYIAVPPARDFATSGLENGLVLAYLGLLWWMMVCWSQALRAYPAETVPPALARRGSRPAARTIEVPQHNAVGWFFDAALAFVAGLSVLVRPELALIGGLALIMMLIAARGWRRRTLIVVAGGLIPVAYQIFRMGYYGLLFPRNGFGEGRLGRQVGAGLGVPRQLRRALPVVAARAAAGGAGAGAAGHPQPTVVDPAGGTARVQPARAHGAKPGGGGDVHRRQRPAAGRLLDPAGRRLHARQGLADADVLSAGAGGRDPRAATGRQQVQPRHRISTCGR